MGTRFGPNFEWSQNLGKPKPSGWWCWWCWCPFLYVCLGTPFRKPLWLPIVLFSRKSMVFFANFSGGQQFCWGGWLGSCLSCLLLLVDWRVVWHFCGWVVRMLLLKRLLLHLFDSGHHFCRSFFVKRRHSWTHEVLWALEDCWQRAQLLYHHTRMSCGRMIDDV